MKHILMILGVAAVLLPLAGQETPVKTKKAKTFQELTPEAERAIARGLEAMAKSQSSSGSFGNGGAPVATTGLAGLAFLAGGHIPGRSKYGENVRKAMQYLMRCCSKSGYINEGANPRGMGGSGIHGHGYALTFLAEAYGMTQGVTDWDADELKEVIVRAVRLSEKAQRPSGGWYYEPTPGGGEEGSTTVTQVAGLRAARNAGVQVNADTIAKAIDYILKSTDDSGMTHYMLSGGQATLALTAAGMSVMNFLGQYSNDKVKKGCDQIIRSVPGRGGRLDTMGNWGYYGLFYSTIAMYQQGTGYWDVWFPPVRDMLVRSQGKDGAWHDGESGQYGEAFGTAHALLILQMPYRYLPIFQRGED